MLKISEFQNIRSIYENKSKYQKNKTILLSSTYSGEGKTTISLNTALSFSKIGKVLLIETDIRRPSVLSKTNLADEAPNVGFSDIIQGGDIKMSDCIMKLPGSEIEVMTSGTRRSDLTDLTTTKKLKKFFKENTLVNQQFIKDSKLSISQYLKSHSDSAKVTGFSRVGLV